MKLLNKKTGEVIDSLQRSELILDYSSIAELNEEWEDYEEPKEYWFINSVGGVTRPSDTTDWEQQDATYHKQIGNYFETKEEAELAVRKLKAWKRLKDKGFKFRGWIREHKKGSADITIASFIDDDFDITDDIDLLFGGGDGE